MNRTGIRRGGTTQHRGHTQAPCGRACAGAGSALKSLGRVDPACATLPSSNLQETGTRTGTQNGKLLMGHRTNNSLLSVGALECLQQPIDILLRVRRRQSDAQSRCPFGNRRRTYCRDETPIRFQ